MPQMYPLNWMIMMPLSVICLSIFLIMIYFLNHKIFFKLKVSSFFYKGQVIWEW